MREISIHYIGNFYTTKDTFGTYYKKSALDKELVKHTKDLLGDDLPEDEQTPVITSYYDVILENPVPDIEYPIELGIYRNKKHGTYYYVRSFSCDSTNKHIDENDGKLPIMVVYSRIYKTNDVNLIMGSTTYVRELEEFKTKFDFVPIPSDRSYFTSNDLK